MKPNFVGIGSVRGGSPWLHYTLSSHPDLLIPTKRKDIQFFTKHWDRGLEWYYEFFTASQEQKDSPRLNIGELSPEYLCSPEAPGRIATVPHINKFILIVRNPVERALSHYKLHLRTTGENISFQDLYSRNPKLILDEGLYARNLKRYLNFFEQKQFLILILEEALANPHAAFAEMGDFFNIDPSLFVVQQRDSLRTKPRHKKLYARVHKYAKSFRNSDKDWLVNLFIKMGAKRLLGRRTSDRTPEISLRQREALYHEFKDDIEELEKLTGKDLSIWKDFSGTK
jgi:hypothetical protein